MGLYDEFRFKPSSWLPHSELPLEELERVRNIKREDMEYTNENGYSVKVVIDPGLCFVQDMFYRILMSDIKDEKLEDYTDAQRERDEVAYQNLVQMAIDDMNDPYNYKNMMEKEKESK